MSLDVLPCAAVHDMADGGSPQSEAVRDDGLRFARGIPAPNLFDERIGHDSESVSLAACSPLGVGSRPIACSASESVRASMCPVVGACRGIASTLHRHIASVCRGVAEKQMVKSDARRIVAPMKDEGSLGGYRPRIARPRPAMGENPPAARRAEFSVAFAPRRARPSPTVRSFYHFSAKNLSKSCEKAA